MTLDPSLATVVCLLGFAALSAVDGLYVHLWRERLHARPGARAEHALHTGRAALFPAILVAFFAGAAPTLGLALLVLDQALEVADMAIERRSRAHTGGLRSSESVLHGALITLRGAAIAFALVAGPTDAIRAVVALLGPGAMLAAGVHVVLLVPVRRSVLA